MDSQDNTSIRRFNFHDYIEPFCHHEMNEFKAPESPGIIIYRSCINWYPTEIDNTPVRLRPAPNKKIKPALSYERVNEMSNDERFKALQHLALSCNRTFEDAKRSLDLKLSELKKKGLPKEQIDAFMLARGLYIAPFYMTAEHGLITDFNNGHGNMLLYEGVKLIDMVIPDSNPVKYEYE